MLAACFAFCDRPCDKPFVTSLVTSLVTGAQSLVAGTSEAAAADHSAQKPTVDCWLHQP